MSEIRLSEEIGLNLYIRTCIYAKCVVVTDSQHSVARQLYSSFLIKVDRYPVTVTPVPTVYSPLVCRPKLERIESAVLYVVSLS